MGRGAGQSRKEGCGLELGPTWSLLWTQLEKPPPGLAERIHGMLPRAAHGPKDWFQLEDVFHLKRAYGFVGEYKDPRTMARAAMLRTAHWEDHREGGLRAEQHSAKLREAYTHSPHFSRTRDWGHWFDRAFVHQLAEHIRRCRPEDGITQFRVEEHLAKSSPRPWSPQVAALVKKSFQREVTSRLNALSKYDGEARTRANLARFDILVRREAVRTLQRMRRLGGAVPPRVWAATFGCIWNRWATSRRRQEIKSCCRCGCMWADDSIEHYARCPTIISFARGRLHLQFRFSSHMQYWMLAAPEDQETKLDGWWERLSLLQYAVLRTLNATRHQGALSGEQADRAFWQAVLEGAKRTRLLNTVWLHVEGDATPSPAIPAEAGVRGAAGEERYSNRLAGSFICSSHPGNDDRNDTDDEPAKGTP